MSTPKAVATAYVSVELWILVNQDGDYVASHDPGVLNELWEEVVGPMNEAAGFRTVKVIVRVPVPTVIELPPVEVDEVDESAALASLS